MAKIAKVSAKAEKEETKATPAKASTKPVAKAAPKTEAPAKAPAKAKAAPKAKAEEPEEVETEAEEGGAEEENVSDAISRKDVAAAMRDYLKTNTQYGMSPKVAEAAVLAFEEVIASALGKGQKIILNGFGQFKVNLRQARVGRNPSSGEAIDIPASYAPVFKCGKKLKEAVAEIALPE